MIAHRLSPRLPLFAAIATFVALSFAAYGGWIPSAVSRHGFDKVLHAALAATLTFLLARVLGRRAWLAAVLVLVPLAIDEYLQRYSAVRSSDWADLAADVAGALLAAWLMRRASRRQRRLPAS